MQSSRDYYRCFALSWKIRIDAAVATTPTSVRVNVTAERALTAAEKVYKVDAEAISRRVKHEFAMRDKAKKPVHSEAKATPLLGELLN